MNKESGLSKGEREMIVVATSGLNSCIYCVVAHGAILRIREKTHSSQIKLLQIIERQIFPKDNLQCWTLP